MLDKRRQQSYQQLIDSIDIRIQLSEALLTSLNSDGGAHQSNPTEFRESSRLRCKGDCVVTIDPDSFRIPGQESESIAIVLRQSRTAIEIIAHQQWFPKQLVQMKLENAQVTAKVRSARLLGPFCYEVDLIILDSRPYSPWIDPRNFLIDRMQPVNQKTLSG